MRYKYIFIAFLIVFASLMEGCGKGGTVCDSGLKPKIISNAPLGQNEVLKLSVFGIDEPKTYTWQGPNGFVSHDKEPAIPNLSKGKGVYTLDVVTQGGCTYSAISDTITVTGPWNACGLDSNNVDLSNVAHMSINVVNGITSSSNYLIQARSSSGGISIEFPNNQPPAEGIYNIQSATGALAAGYARATIDVVTVAPYDATSGKVYVSVDGMVTTISFCGVSFKAQDNSGSTTCRANIMWGLQ
jgi:hypothetical protein